jgi:hypothetical protein
MKPIDGASKATIARPGCVRPEHPSWRSKDEEQVRMSFRDLRAGDVIARHRELVRDIREVIALTRKIIESTREQLDRFDALGAVGSVVAPKHVPPPQAAMEAEAPETLAAAVGVAAKGRPRQ